MGLPGGTREKGVRLLLLLLLCIGAMAANLLYGEPAGKSGEILLLGLLLGLTVAAAFILSAEKGDLLLLAATLFLGIISVFLVWRLDPAQGWRQLFHIAVGLLFYLGIVRLPWEYRVLELYAYLAGLGMVLATFITLVFGESVGGQRAWLFLGPFHFEPAELAKILLVVFWAGYLVNARADLVYRRFTVLGRNVPLPNWRYLAPALFFTGVLEFLLVGQKDFGAVVLFFVLFAVMAFLGTGRPSYAVISILFAVLAVAVAGRYSHHIADRIAIWLNPWPLADREGYQMVQSLYAMARGGIFGTGLGLGWPDRIPAGNTDFILAVAGEEMGFAGSAALLLGEYFILHRGYMVAAGIRERYGFLLASGLTSLLAVQNLMIIGGVTRLLPLTGITLPFVSYGGSAVVSGFIAIGLLSKISGEELRHATE